MPTEWNDWRTTTSAIPQFAREKGELVMATTGRGIIERAQVAGRALTLFFQTTRMMGDYRRVMPQLMRQIDLAGFGSIMVLSLIAGLTGMIMAVQTGTELQKFGVVENLGAIIGATFCREMGPIWAAVIILARVGGAMAAELGTMAVNEEVDALRVMSINPVRYLVLPRILALVIVMPLLTAVADFVGMFGGALISKATFNMTLRTFFESAQDKLTFLDVSSGLFKSVVIACLIATIACDQGLNTSDGAEGVGRSTTKTVVLCIIFVLLTDFFLTSFVQLVLQRLIYG
jgi:phospholipid/cholesterol/gamma-HCH transport system permease protein